MVTAVATSVATALCIAAVFAILKSRWLYVIAPKLYLNTPLSDGQVVSLTLMNAGLVHEEDVAITFKAPIKFELIATSKSTLAVNGRTISLPKLSRGESVTVLLLIEGKAFAPEDIDSVESKATKGKVVESKEKVAPLWQHLIVWPLLVLVLGLPFLFGTYVGSEMGVSGFGYLNEKLEVFGASKQLAGYKHQVFEQYSNGSLKGVLNAKRLNIEVQEVVRRGDVLNLQVKIVNGTGQIVSVYGNIEGTSGTGPLSFYDSRISTFGMAPNETKTLKLKVFQPEAASVQLVQGTYHFNSPDGGNLSVSQTITF